jgi:uncharacterized protein (DUF488 family)
MKTPEGPRTVYTVGYEGSSISDFIETIRVIGVQTVLDIRAVPVSRKLGFSKHTLAQKLADAGLHYAHIPALGDPKPGRDAARQGELSKFRRVFGDHLRLEASRAALADISQLAISSVACLLCFERAHSCCHRSLVADAMSEFGSFRVRHIGVRSGISSNERIRDAVASRETRVR